MAEPSVVLFWGDDEFLLRLEAHTLLEARGVRAVEVDASEWRGGETSDLATPSLWGEARALLVTRCQALADSGTKELTAYVASPAPDALCVLTHVTGGRTPPKLARAVGDGGGAARQVALRRADLPKWLVDRARTRSLKLEGPAAAELVRTLGDSPAVLDQAVEQLSVAFSGQPVGPEQVRAQFQGLGEQKVWDLFDRAFTGRAAEALVVLRTLLEALRIP